MIYQSPLTEGNSANKCSLICKKEKKKALKSITICHCKLPVYMKLQHLPTAKAARLKEFYHNCSVSSGLGVFFHVRHAKTEFSHVLYRRRSLDPLQSEPDHTDGPFSFSHQSRGQDGSKLGQNIVRHTHTHTHTCTHTHTVTHTHRHTHRHTHTHTCLLYTSPSPRDA